MPPFDVKLIYEVCGGTDNSPVTPVLEPLLNITSGQQIYLELSTDGIKKYEDYLKVEDKFQPKVVRPECCAYDCDLKYNCRNCPVDNGFAAITLDFQDSDENQEIELAENGNFTISNNSTRRRKRSVNENELTSNYHLDSWSDWMDYGEPSGILMRLF